MKPSFNLTRKLRQMVCQRRKQLVFVPAILLACWVALGPVHSASTDLDPSFGNGGKVITDFGSNFQEFGNAMALQPDGKIVVVGTSGANFAVARYNADGSLDPTFGSGGRVTTLTLQSDGKIVVAGGTYSSDFSSSGFALLRYNANGSLDANFGAGGKVATDFDGPALGQAVALQPNGQIVMAGSASTASSAYNFALARFNPNGSPDTNFDSDGKLTTVHGKR